MRVWRAPVSVGAPSWRLGAGAVFGLLFACQAAQPTSEVPASARCATCHLAEYQATSHPPHPGVRPTTCGTCHTSKSWHPYRLEHSFPLSGAHAKAACFACHSAQPPRFEGTAKECVACHQAESTKANAEVQRHASFPLTCDTCHSTSAWKPTLPHETLEPSEPFAPASPSASAAETRRNAPANGGAATTRTATSPASATHAAVTPNAPNARARPARLPRPTTPTPPPDTVTGASRPWRK